MLVRKIFKVPTCASAPLPIVCKCGSEALVVRLCSTGTACGSAVVLVLLGMHLAWNLDLTASFAGVPLKNE